MTTNIWHSKGFPADGNAFRVTLVWALAILVLMLGTNPSTLAQAPHPKAAAIQESAPQATHVWELPAQGPPTTNVLVQGAGFDPLTAIDIYFDTTKLASTTTDKTGSFGNGVVTTTGATFAHLQVPASALPGQHIISAQERVGQKSAHIAFLVRTDSPQFRFDAQHTGLNPYENVLSTTTVGNLIVDWQFSTGNAISSTPAVANGVVYVGSDDKTVYALNADTGAVIWEYATEGMIHSSPAIASGVVYIGSFDKNVYALSATTGVLLWKFPTDQPIHSSPTVVNGVVYIGSDDGNVYALNATKGTLIRTYATGFSVWSSPAVANDALYVGSNGGYVHAFNTSTGALLWTFQTHNQVYSSPTVVGGIVYVGSLSGMPDLYALDASSGGVLWSFTAGAGFSSSPAVANGAVYIGGRDANFYALDARTGMPLWTYSADGVITSSAAVANGVVYFASSFDGHAVYALNANTGALLWEHPTGDGIESSPAVADGMVYIGSNDKSLYAFHLPGQKIPVD